MKMSVNDAAEHFGISKEAIHNRIRRGSLEVVVEEGVKYVLVDENTTTSNTKKATSTRATTQRAANSGDRYHKFLEEQNAKLQSRVEVLEGETRTLRDQKELMLVEERKKIEAIYKEKDEQLKNVLSTLSSQFMLNAPEPQKVETLDVELEEVVSEPEAKIVSLKKYLKRLNYSEKKSRKITTRFEKKADKDERIIMIGDKIYLDTVRYDYSDLLKK